MLKQLTGWGKYPTVDATVHTPDGPSALRRVVDATYPTDVIARGLGRSYGDSSLAGAVVDTGHLNRFIDFDHATGSLRCSAGVTLAEILDVFVPKGWFLPVSPGTKFVTVGGAIASDVHGKNHHLEGSFSDHVSEIHVATVSDGMLRCSPDDHRELFLATCGGMGLTGIIAEATIRLKPIRSAQIDQVTIKTRNLQDTLDLFLEHHDTTYSVAWIDCLAGGDSLGRSLLTMGEHATEGDLTPSGGPSVTVPVDLPGKVLNRRTVQAFNALYYNRITSRKAESRVHYDSFFYPLDGIHHWNRIYGSGGFTQYQFVIPRDGGASGLTDILQRVSASGRASFLAVLKAFGPGNQNYLSFPIDGYTLALDFKLDPGLFELLETLDQIVLGHGGRIYLSKDVRMSPETFQKGYPGWPDFARVRTRYRADEVFNSLQSRRLGL